MITGRRVGSGGGDSGSVGSEKVFGTQPYYNDGRCR